MRQMLVTKPRVLCLHGYRESAAIMERHMEVWPNDVLEKMDLVFIDAPFPAEETSGPEGKCDSHLSWLGTNEDFTEFKNFDETIAYIEGCMVEPGPFDGLLRFSQGSMIAALLPGLQTQGVSLTKVDKIKFVIVIAGGKLGGSKFSAPELAKNVFSSPTECSSLHFIGEKDFAKPGGIELLGSYVNPFVIYHQEGHVIPKLGNMQKKIICLVKLLITLSVLQKLV
ncbi:hypothetical protein RJ639_001001 [Escallonia herrerae]|uniref:Serine hydrolase domain-containing protein n=1 Tax=Escallonia herrerae TaxID=1293975 RepID=A0AA88XIB8_9ASTE|nr:hypothetical protein RJ639_001001 [Escallonia herrerae]